jgi:hypothetical protein
MKRLTLWLMCTASISTVIGIGIEPLDIECNPGREIEVDRGTEERDRDPSDLESMS